MLKLAARTNQMKAISLLGPLIIGMLLVLILNRLEHALDPVVEKFLITNLVKSQESIHMSGFLLKVRECEFAGITATTTGGVQIPLSFRDSKNHSVSRPTGYQAWGPWELTVPLDKVDMGVSIDLYQIHQCHPFWQTRSFLTSIPINYD